MKTKGKARKPDHLKWTLSGGALMVVGIFCLSFESTETLGFILLAIGFVPNLIGVLKATSAEAKAASQGEKS